MLFAGAVEAAVTRLTGLRSARNLSVVDIHMDADVLEALTQAEVLEAQDEAESGDRKKEAGELVDVFAFLVAVCNKHDIVIDFSQVASGAVLLGQRAKNSAFYQIISQEVGDLRSGRIAVTKNGLINLFSLIIARIEHLSFEFPAVVDMLIAKLSANRPVEYYLREENGIRLGLRYFLAKYDHNEMMLRLLRTRYRSPLAEWMHQPYAELILDFRNSDRNLKETELLIEADKALITKYVACLAKFEPVDRVNRRRLEAQLIKRRLLTPSEELSGEKFEIWLSIGGAEQMTPGEYRYGPEPEREFEVKPPPSNIGHGFHHVPTETVVYAAPPILNNEPTEFAPAFAGGD